MDKLIITVAPCMPAAVLKTSPSLPHRSEEIADEIVRAWEAGASIAHLHVIDEDGLPTQDLTTFRRTIAIIRERCDILIEGSTGGINTLSAAERSVSLQADIDLASLNPGSVNYDQGVYINSPQDVDYWVYEMNKRGIKPDIAIFEVGMVANAMAYFKHGLDEPPHLFSFVVGQKGALPATPKNILFLSETVPQNSVWSVVGHGGNDLWTSVMAMTMGGHARAGFEDNHYFKPGEPAVSNAQLVERLKRFGRDLGREPATPAETRTILGLPPRHRA